MKTLSAGLLFAGSLLAQDWPTPQRQLTCGQLNREDTTTATLQCSTGSYVLTVDSIDPRTVAFRVLATFINLDTGVIRHITVWSDKVPNVGLGTGTPILLIPLSQELIYSATVQEVRQNVVYQ